MGGKYAAWEAGEITPEAVLAHKAPTEGFLCPLAANKYGIDFREFEIKDYDKALSLFHVTRPADAPAIDVTQVPEHMEDQVRSIQYTFPKAFFDMETIKTSLVFSVGSEPVPSLRMIERHYFKGELQRSYDFTFGFCIPGSTNSWEAVYPVPQMSAAQKEDMLNCPHETASDSFYFVGDTLIMHNKASYAYSG